MSMTGAERDGSGDGDSLRTEPGAAFEVLRRDGVLRVRRPGTEWLSTGPNGGRRESPAAYNLTVPEGWSRTDLERYVSDRLDRAGFDEPGPALLTGVDVADARGARCGPVTAVATAGLSNPAVLPMDPESGSLPRGEMNRPGGRRETAGDVDRDGDEPIGTVNLLVGTSRALAPGALANLLAVAVEAKAATLLATTGFPGTTTDAVVVGHDPAGAVVRFSGSATPVGTAARACVREAVRAALRARYDEGDASVPASLADADHGVSTDVRAAVFLPAEES